MLPLHPSHRMREHTLKGEKWRGKGGGQERREDTQQTVGMGFELCGLCREFGCWMYQGCQQGSNAATHTYHNLLAHLLDKPNAAQRPDSAVAGAAAVVVARVTPGLQACSCCRCTFGEAVLMPAEHLAG